MEILIAFLFGIILNHEMTKEPVPEPAPVVVAEPIPEPEYRLVDKPEHAKKVYFYDSINGYYITNLAPEEKE